MSDAERREKEEHRFLIKDLARQYMPIMDLSSDGIYIYLDDEHKLCNGNLANLWGYSQEEWNNNSPFLENLVAEGSRFKIMRTYKEARENFFPQEFEFTGLRKDGSDFKATAGIVPISYHGRFLTLNIVKLSR